MSLKRNNNEILNNEIWQRHTDVKKLDRRCRAFTLAESIAVLVVLGIVAALTIPQVVRRQIEAANRTKIKKSMKVFDLFTNKIVVENDLKNNTALKNWATENDCENSLKYFKPVKFIPKEDGTTTNCRFMTSDKVAWDLSNYPDATFSLKEEDLDKEDSPITFKPHAHFDGQGILRVNDLGWELANATDDKIVKDIEKMLNPTKASKEIAAAPKRELKHLTYYYANGNIKIDTTYYIDENGQKIATERIRYDESGTIQNKEIFGNDYYELNSYLNGELIQVVRKANIENVLTDISTNDNDGVSYWGDEVKAPNHQQQEYYRADYDNRWCTDCDERIKNTPSLEQTYHEGTSKIQSKTEVFLNYYQSDDKPYMTKNTTNYQLYNGLNKTTSIISEDEYLQQITETNYNYKDNSGSNYQKTQTTKDSQTKSIINKTIYQDNSSTKKMSEIKYNMDTIEKNGKTYYIDRQYNYKENGITVNDTVVYYKLTPTSEEAVVTCSSSGSRPNLQCSF